MLPPPPKMAAICLLCAFIVIIVSMALGTQQELGIRLGVIGLGWAFAGSALWAADVTREQNPEEVRKELSKAFYAYFAFISEAAAAQVPGFYWDDKGGRCGIEAKAVPQSHRWRAGMLQQRVDRWRNAAKRLGMSTNPNDYAP